MRQKDRPWFIVVCVLLACVGGAGIGQAAEISVGKLKVRKSKATAPVLLEVDSAERLSTITCDVTFDASRFKVTDVAPGSSSKRAKKQVQWNEREPGHVSLVIYGVNQNTIKSGVIAQMRFERLEPPAPLVVEASASTPDGQDVPVNAPAASSKGKGAGPGRHET